MGHDLNRRGHLPSRLPWMRLFGSPLQQILCSDNLVFARSARTNQEGTMSAIYVLGGTVAVGLLIYLVIALLKPEVFS